MDHRDFDKPGTLVLALTLAAYALAVTAENGAFSSRNLVLLALAALGIAVFLRVERRSPAPLVRLSVFRNPALNAALAMSALVSTVMMTTLVVGPFYLSRVLGHPAAVVGLVISVGWRRWRWGPLRWPRCRRWSARPDMCWRWRSRPRATSCSRRRTTPR